MLDNDGHRWTDDLLLGRTDIVKGAHILHSVTRELSAFLFEKVDQIPVTVKISNWLILDLFMKWDYLSKDIIKVLSAYDFRV